MIKYHYACDLTTTCSEVVECGLIYRSKWSAYKSLQKETKIIQQIKHKFIPKYIGSYETKNGCVLVMEYIEGQNISGKTFTIKEVYEITIKLLKILVYLQERSVPITHRDIKPENILIDKFYNIYLIDFGLYIEGNYNQSISVSTVVGGTIGFTPPELLLGNKPSKNSDLYSLAATIFCLLTNTSTGKLASFVDSSFRLPLKDLKGKIGDEWMYWLEKCADPDFEKRLVSADIALEKLERINPKYNYKIKLKKKKSRNILIELLGGDTSWLYALSLGVGVPISFLVICTLLAKILLIFFEPVTVGVIFLLSPIWFGVPCLIFTIIKGYVEL